MKASNVTEKSRAFTLELLVVIAIIAILTACSSGSFKAKTKAQGISCMNNLKQLGLAWHMCQGITVIGWCPMERQSERVGGGWSRPRQTQPIRLY